MSNAGGGDTPSFHNDDLKHVLGKQVAKLISTISRQAHERDLSLFLVGGVARDLMLGVRNLDLDFVIEGDAIDFAKALVKRFGGAMEAHTTFGTAKWTLDPAAAEGLSAPLDELPDHVDIAAARTETYAYPTALPTVSASDIERDLLRRDFSVNTLALQLSPAAQSNRLLDVCGGIKDLRDGLIRVLHDQSFVDDPTRILRAARYALRLDFAIESHTAEWMRTALPFLGRITGQRLRNEIDLILREPNPGEVMLRLQELGALENIHPAFRVSPRLPELIARCHELRPPWPTDTIDRQTLRWNMLFTGIGAADAQEICERLALTKALRQSITASATLSERARLLEDPAIRPSQVTQLLEGFPDSTLQLGWLLSADIPKAQAKLSAYASDWRQRRSTINGNDLKAMGIAPGPRYRRILDQLRFAWVDGDIKSVEEERRFLQQLLETED